MTCNSPGCVNPAESGPKCGFCKRMQRRGTDERRGSSADRGYGRDHQAARKIVLKRDPYCKCLDVECREHPDRPCLNSSTVADHYPLTRRELEAAGKDPNRPEYQRGLCARCHNRHTGKTSSGRFGQ